VYGEKYKIIKEDISKGNKRSLSIFIE